MSLEDMAWQLGQRLRMLVTRGAVTASTVAKRTLVSVRGLASETGEKIELLLPYGFSARPDAGDVLLFQVTGSRAHLVAVGADKTSLRITDLASGEFGWQDNQSQSLVFRQDGLEIATPLKLTVSAKSAEIATTGDVSLSVGGDATIAVTGTATLTAEKIQLGGAGGKAVVVDGDPVKGGVVHATVEDVLAK